VVFADIGRRFRGIGSLALLLACVGGGAVIFIVAAGTGAAGAPAQSGTANWVLTWSDEFDAPDGSAPDPKKWTAETGGGGWGNNELEYYTARQTNSRVEKGNLVIDALQEKFTGPDGVAREYTSARLKTGKLFTQKYGKFEARIRIPKGQGMWPAFWMLGDDISAAGWPACGEIDIMENVGFEPATIHGTIHGPGYSGGKSLGAPYALSSGNVADDFHVFAVEWEPKEIRFYVDGQLYETRTPADLPAGTRWVFDHPFFVILNVAVGGGWPGNPDASTKFPQQMLVDYVRVYSRN
jgi:beta-glucanase (GH16 family)